MCKFINHKMHDKMQLNFLQTFNGQGLRNAADATLNYFESDFFYYSRVLFFFCFKSSKLGRFNFSVTTTRVLETT